MWGRGASRGADGREHELGVVPHDGFGERRVHDRGGKVYVWTVNEPDEVELVLDLRVDGIITDRPRRVLDRLASAG